MTEISREEFVERITMLHAAVLAVQASVDRINGRLREAEQRVAVLDDRAATPGAAAVWGGGGAGLVVSLIEGLRWWLGK